MRSNIWILVVSLALGTSRGALAQPAIVHVEVDEPFRRAGEAAARGDIRLALDLFRSSYDHEPGRGKLLNIAICEEKLGFLVMATQHFQQVSSQLAPGDERRSVVQQHLADLGARVAHLRVALVAGAPLGVTITLEGAQLARTTMSTEMTLDPGEYVVSVNARGRSERRYDLLLQEGKAVTLTVEPGQATPPEPAQHDDAPPPQNSRRKIGFLVGGVGVTGLAVGGLTGIIALIHRGAVESQCPTHRGCSPDIVNQASAGKALSVASVIGFSAGAVGVGAGVSLLLLDKTAPAAATVGVMLLPGGGLIAARGSF